MKFAWSTLACWSCCCGAIEIMLPAGGSLKQWRAELLRNYSSASFGPLSFGEPVNISLGVNIRNVPDINLATRQVTMKMWVRLAWFDPEVLYAFDSLEPAWNSDSDFIPMLPDDLWKPHVACNTCGSGGDFFQDGIYVYDSKFAERHGYNVFSSRPASFTTVCNIKLDLFPFDTQFCSARFESWTLSGSWLKLQKLTPFVDTSELHEGTMEYSINYTSKSIDLEYSFFSNWPSLSVGVGLTRKPHYYVANAIAPMGLLVCLSTAVLWLPLDGVSQGAGERLTYAVTLLLTTIASTLVTAAMRPPVGYDTWLDKYQYYCIVFTAFPIVETVILYWFAGVFSQAARDYAEHDAILAEEAEAVVRTKSAEERETVVRRQKLVHAKLRRTVAASKHSVDTAVWMAQMMGAGRIWTVRDIDAVARIIAPCVEAVLLTNHMWAVRENLAETMSSLSSLAFVSICLFWGILLIAILSMANRIIRSIRYVLQWRSGNVDDSVKGDDAKEEEGCSNKFNSTGEERSDSEQTLPSQPHGRMLSNAARGGSTHRLPSVGC